MRRCTPLPCLCAAILALAAASVTAAEPAAELGSFSVFKNLDVNKLAGGKVQMLRGPTMGFSRGLAIESCYLVRKPLAKTVEFQKQWIAQRHPELRAWIHSPVPARASANDFKGLASAPSNSSVKSFMAATEKLGSGSTTLQMSAAEAKSFSGSGGPGAFWGNLLAHRASAYGSGGLGKLPPYETTGEPARAADETARLLKEVPKVRGQFGALLDAFAAGKGASAHYWEMIDIEGQAAVALGVQHFRSAGPSMQALDAEYYSSGGYYVLITLYQMWPINAGGQDATLVWRGDLISAPQLGELRGVERMGSGSAMMRETQKTIDLFLKDAGSK